MPGIPATLFAEGEVEPSVVCLLCRGVLLDAKQLQECGCIFCDSCLRAAFSAANDVSHCPQCRFDAATIDLGPGEVAGSPATFTILPMTSIDDRIQRLRIRCLNHANGCTTSPPLCELDAHLAECFFRMVPCNLCKRNVISSETVSHQKSECPERMVACDHCAEQIAGQTAMKLHLDQCPSLLVPCPNECIAPHSASADDSSASPLLIARSKVHEHLEQCSRAKIACPLARFGCAFVGVRSDLSDHENTEARAHLAMVIAKYDSDTLSMKTQIESLQQKLSVSSVSSVPVALPVSSAVAVPSLPVAVAAPQMKVGDVFPVRHLDGTAMIGKVTAIADGRALITYVMAAGGQSVVRAPEWVSLGSSEPSSALAEEAGPGAFQSAPVANKPPAISISSAAAAVSSASIPAARPSPKAVPPPAPRVAPPPKKALAKDSSASSVSAPAVSPAPVPSPASSVAIAPAVLPASIPQPIVAIPSSDVLPPPPPPPPEEPDNQKQMLLSLQQQVSQLQSMLLQQFKSTAAQQAPVLDLPPAPPAPDMASVPQVIDIPPPPPLPIFIPPPPMLAPVPSTTTSHEVLPVPHAPPKPTFIPPPPRPVNPQSAPNKSQSSLSASSPAPPASPAPPNVSETVAVAPASSIVLPAAPSIPLEAPPVIDSFDVLTKEFASTLRVGDTAEVQDQDGKYVPASILKRESDSVLVSFSGYDSRFNEWISIHTDHRRFVPMGLYTVDQCTDFEVGDYVEFVNPKSGPRAGEVCPGRIVRVEAMQICVEYRLAGVLPEVSLFHWFTVESSLLRAHNSYA